MIPWPCKPYFNRPGFESNSWRHAHHYRSTHTHAHTRTRTHVHAHMHTHAHAHTHTRTHTRTRTHTHTHTHTHLHTHTTISCVMLFIIHTWSCCNRCFVWGGDLIDIRIFAVCIVQSLGHEGILGSARTPYQPNNNYNMLMKLYMHGDARTALNYNIIVTQTVVQLDFFIICNACILQCL